MNNWVQYIDRNFSSIKTSILNGLDTTVTELTDRSPSNLLMVIVDIFAGVAELTNYYIDITARELYLPTARRLSSLIKLANLANYNGKARTAAYTTLTLTALDVNGDPILNPTTAFTIPSGSLFTDTSGNQWVSQHAQVLRLGFSSAQFSVRQYTAVIGATLGTTNGSVNQAVPLPAGYRDSSLAITILGASWELVESFGFSSATDKHCVVALASDGIVYVTFGDGVNGAIPTGSSTILADYHTTEGLGGNTEDNTITTITSTLTPPTGVTSFSVTNLDPAAGGREIEGIEELRKAIPIALRTLNRAVTRKDYEDVAILSADIRAARVEWNCGARLQVYLVSHGGGNPTQSILDDTKTFIESRSMLTLPITTHPSGESHVRGQIDIVGRFRALGSVITTKSIEALQNLYNPFTSVINQDIRLSDVIAAIDNIPEVDYLTLDHIYVEPYLRPSNPAAPLAYTITLLPAVQVKSSWTILYDPASDPVSPFYIYKEGTFLVKMAAGTSEAAVGGLLDIEIVVVPGSVAQGDIWTFTIYPYNLDVNLDDLSIPVVSAADFVINVKQTYVPI